MRMPTLTLIGASLVLAGAAAPALAGDRPGVQTPRPGANWNGVHRWGPRHNGRWFAGWRAPGGWAGYRRPVRGFILPRYWISPSYYIANYGAYGLPAPAYGYGWSRYYDDAVMTDRYGRVYDHRSDVDWGRYEGGYEDAPRDAPPPRRPGAGYDDGYGYDDDVVTSGGEYGSNAYDGRWIGTWTTEDGRQVSGTYEGRFEGDVRGAGVDYDAPPYGAAHWGHGPMPGPAGGYISGGYYYPAPTVTTVTVQPAVTTTTTTTYVTEKVAYRKPARKLRRACRCK